MPDPITNPPAPAAQTDPPAKEAPPDPEEAKYRRLFEKRDAEFGDLKKQLEGLLAEKKTAADELAKTTAAEDLAKKTEQEKLDLRIAELESRAKKAEHDALRLRIAGEHKITGDALEFLSASDEAGLRLQAEKLAKLMPAPAAGEPAPVRAGTTTRPGTAPAPGIQERIDAAYKGGNLTEAIRLKREAAGLGVMPES